MAERITSIDDLKPDPRNANKGTARGHHMIEQSVRARGAARSGVAANDGSMIAGTQTLLKMQELGIPVRAVHTDGTEWVVVVRDDVTPGSETATLLAIDDNRASEVGLEWDADVLAGLVAEGVDLSGLWREDELDALLAEAAPDVLPGNGGDEYDATPADGPTRCQPGDLWQIGPHRLLVGDSTVASDVARLLGDAKPALMVTDPPYGVEYDPGWRNEAAEKGLIAFAVRREGKVMNDGRVDWSEAWALFPGNVVYCWHADRHASQVQVTLEQAGFEVRSQIIWAKPRFVISRGHYHWQHEPCWYAVRKGATAEWVGDRSQTTLWQIPMRDDTQDSNHGTQKPLDCMMRPLQNHAGDVYDPFLGSGTTLIAAHRTGRVCFGMELSPTYADVILKRAEAEGIGPIVRVNP